MVSGIWLPYGTPVHIGSGSWLPFCTTVHISCSSRLLLLILIFQVVVSCGWIPLGTSYLLFKQVTPVYICCSGSGLWQLIASWFSWPVAGTHCIIFGLLGFTVTAKGTFSQKNLMTKSPEDMAMRLMLYVWSSHVTMGPSSRGIEYWGGEVGNLQRIQWCKVKRFKSKSISIILNKLFHYVLCNNKWSGLI